MNINIRGLASFVILIIAHEAAADTITGLELLRRMQAAPSDAIVQYCSQNAPETNQLFEEGYAVYLSSLNKAVTTWVAENPERLKDLQSQIPSDSVQVRQATATIKNIRSNIQNNIKQYNPKQYCPSAANWLKVSTSESILKLLHEYEARVNKGLQGRK